MGVADHGHAVAHEEPRDKLWDLGTNCKSQVFHPATYLFSLAFLKEQLSFSAPAPHHNQRWSSFCVKSKV